MEFPSKYKTVEELNSAIETKIENLIQGCYRILTPAEERMNTAYDEKKYVVYNKERAVVSTLRLEIRSLETLRDDLLISDEQREYESNNTPQF